MAAPDHVANDAGILDGIRIVDLSDGIAGPVATLILAEAGADVVAVEPPGGAANRGTCRVPHLDAQQAQRRARPRAARRPRPRSTDLLAAADVVVHNYGPTRARELGLDDESLAARFPQLIVSSMLSWPANHADADLPVDELLAMARLGVLDEQQGYRDGPIFLRCPIGSWCASHLARHRHRGPPDRAPAHRARRPRAHALAQGALVPDGDALAAGREPVAVVGDRHAQGADRRHAVRVRRRRVDPPDG